MRKIKIDQGTNNLLVVVVLRTSVCDCKLLYKIKHRHLSSTHSLWTPWTIHSVPRNGHFDAGWGSILLALHLPMLATSILLGKISRRRTRKMSKYRRYHQINLRVLSRLLSIRLGVLYFTVYHDRSATDEHTHQDISRLLAGYVCYVSTSVGLYDYPSTDPMKAHP